MRNLVHLFLILFTGTCVTRAAVPELPAHHVEILDDILRKYVNYSQVQQGSLVDYLLGNPVVAANENDTNLDINVLNYKTFKKILETSKDKHKSEGFNSRRGWFPNHEFIDKFPHREGYVIERKALELMRQSIYTIRERLEDTLYVRQKYAHDLVYQIGIIVGNVHQLNLKSDQLFTQMLNFNFRYVDSGTATYPQHAPKFIWYLIIYEKLLAVNTDVTDLVKRAFRYQNQWLGTILQEEKDDEANKPLSSRPKNP